MKMLKVIMLFALIITPFLNIGCASATKVGDVLANPSQYEGKNISVRGTVGDTACLTLADKGVYQIGDGSGTIWVVTTQPPPQRGQSISTTGKVSVGL